MKFARLKCLSAAALWLGSAWVCGAQSTTPTADPPASADPAAAPAAPPAPMPLGTPTFTGPLSNLPPATFDAGPFGHIAVNGMLTGYGMAQDSHIPGDKSAQAALSNGQIFIQKADGWFQFYLQAGAYNIPALGTPFLQTDKTISNLYGPLPVAFLKLQAGKNTSFMIGQLPTLIGAEYTFTFENMNVSRGLLWNQENAISRGIQVNQTLGKFTLSASWNDGFYSNRYTWMTGTVAYANGPHTIAFVAGGNFGQTAFQTYATPVQNNGSIYNLIYTYNKGSWIIQPYYQHTDVPANQKIGIVKGNTTDAGAILVNHTFKHGFSLPVRWEYIASGGKSTDPDVVNLMYGPGSHGTSITVTPTFQYGGFFFRGDVAYVHTSSYTPGSVFGPQGNDPGQFRAAAEIGFIFGNNIVEKKP
jgi:hypothetical protein